MEAVLEYLRMKHPDAILDAMTNGPERMKSHYGIKATQLFHEHQFAKRPSRAHRAAWLLWEKCVETYKIAAWTRAHDVVVIPGMGVLETTLPTVPWGMPYAMYVLSVAGKLFQTKVALVSVGASNVRQRSTRWLYTQAARLAYYRSYRDARSLDVMTRLGLDTSRDPIYPDLAFAIPVPPYDPGDARTVGIGVMRYTGSNDDRRRAAEIRASYVQNVKLFTRWLIDNDYRIQLFFGDSDDEVIAREILSDLADYAPVQSSAAVTLQPVSTFDEVTRVVQSVCIVVATRFHNVICAVRLAKPTLSLGYANKSAVIMADAGLAEFTLAAQSLDVDQLIERFKELESRAPELRERMQENTAAKARLLDEQFDLLSATLLSSARKKIKRGSREEAARPRRPQFGGRRQGNAV